ncbi:MAG: leucyl aminopeptidase family protein [Caulobacter sp.]|nr:leucyl aminopeptidase family protein [Caulobacter sp.]
MTPICSSAAGLAVLALLSTAAAPAALAAPAAVPAAAKPSPARVAATQRRPVSFAAAAPAPGGLLVIPASGAEQAAARAASLPPEQRAAIARAATSAGFKYGSRKTLTLRGIGDFDQIVLLGLGETPSANDVQMAGAVAGRALAGETGTVTVLAPDMDAAAVAELAAGFGLGEYRSDLYSTDRKATTPAPVTLVADAAQAAAALYRTRGLPLVEAMQWARDVSNEPGNTVYPEAFVERARAAFAGAPGVSIEVLDVPAMQRLGMGALVGVGAGSARPPRLLVVRYRGAGAPAGGPVVLVGKGITFDSGGISIKPGSGMGNMKMDMSGAAAVVGAVLSLSKSAAPVDVVAVAAVAENMPDGAAIRPGDVLTAMNGKTIEVINTDAEGRLVLADALVWSERNLGPAVVVDIATLTGAVGGALGDDYAGLFTRHDALAGKLTAAGEATGEALWRLPLHPSYAKDTSSTIADIKNSGDGPGAGTGAWFVGEFISRDIPWAHIDMAGVGWSAAGDWKPAGSAGFGVRLLDSFVRDWGK